MSRIAADRSTRDQAAGNDDTTPPDGADGFGNPAIPVIDGQLRLVERLSVEMAEMVLARGDTVLSLISRLRQRLLEDRRERGSASVPAGPVPPASARQVAHEAQIDGLVFEIEHAMLGILAEAQRQDALRQVLDGISALAAASVAPGLAAPDRFTALLFRLDAAAERFVMEEQRVAFALALGREPPASGPRLELF